MTRIHQHFTILITIFVLSIKLAKCQIENRPPQFISGSGDMARFSLSENTTVGSPVYRLQGIDPEGGALRYSISGPVFTVDRDSGVVRLSQELDREKQDLIEVIISLTDEGIFGSEPNTISLRREIPIRDYNDNSPVFIGRPYTTSVSESTVLGSEIQIHPRVIVTDRDEGQNAEINLSCYHHGNHDSNICDTFRVEGEKLSDGNYTAHIKLLKQLDFETRPSYILTIMAKDNAPLNPLSAFATISINVEDVQDQPPTFINAPYSTTVQENTAEHTSIMTISAVDGDGGHPRTILLSLEDESKGYFRLDDVGNKTYGKAILYTTDIPLDREDNDILQNGGVYSFRVKATELINNEVPADFSYNQITIILTDVDDHLPEFNRNEFNISIPENLEYDTSLPGLSIYVNDKDLGVNSQYNLTLKNVQNAENVFTVSPRFGEGRTPIIVKVINPTKLDYDIDDASARTLIFDIIASVHDKELAKTHVTVHLQDVNDNSPKFTQQNYHPMVKENAKINSKIMDIIGTDKDSEEFGKIRYLLKGFGTDYFYTDPNEGGLYVKRALDYERQKSYSLTIVAVDGGGRESNANLLIDVIDVNDNYPMFESLEYTRTIREGATTFEPQFFVHAIDVDGPEQGGGRILYSIESENSISGHVFTIDGDSGEIKINEPVNSMDTERGQYELSVTATDYGVPALKNNTRVLVRVGISGNQRPVFKGHFNSFDKGDIPGPPSYRVSIPENATPGYNVTTVTATDPDGIDSLLMYQLVGANDNFLIDDRSGLVTVSNVSHLDRDTNPDHYAVVISAVDAGFPIPETATTTLFIQIDDVNDKPPRFKKSSYTAYVSERAEIDTEVVQVQAIDTDLDSKLNYSIIEPIKAISKTGTQFIGNGQRYNYRMAFAINAETGLITINNTLNHDQFAAIILTIKSVDMNALYNKDLQYAITEVTIYIQSFKDINPVFLNKGWTSSRPVVNVKIKEELPIDGIAFKLLAEDPVNNEEIRQYEIIDRDPYEMFEINEYTGDIILRKRLDYEMLNSTQIEFSVKATAQQDQRRQTVTKVNVTVLNVNDNSPIFDHRIYKTTIIETAKYPEKIYQVNAIDHDAVLNDLDERNGYHQISYFLTGTSSMLFTINNKTGIIQIAPNQTIDREQQARIELKVVAEDAHGKPAESRRSTTTIVIDVLDVNDNAPMFEHKFYTAVIPETADIDTFVVNITANDPDEGPGGEIRYDFMNEGDANGLLKINILTGEIRTKIPLTGKGRSQPYDLIVRAQDNGGQIPKQESLFTDVSFTLYIGDVSANDGIPYFVSPKIGQSANISENATIGSPVFQVIAKDPDSPSTPSGTLRYHVQDDNQDAKYFRIDSNSGLITTIRQLDRETQSSYSIIVEVMDNGQPSQATTRVLLINIIDIDDHKPRFIREVDSRPFELTVLEEQPIGTVVGNITAIDEDINENGAIDYLFIDDNHEDLFKITRTSDNAAIITTLQQLDREVTGSFLLTIKCFKNGITHSQINKQSYNLYELSEIQILIKIQDIDDHLPEFEQRNPAIGIRLNIPIDKPIIIMKAQDIDPDAKRIEYRIVNLTFIPQFYKRENFTKQTDFTKLFTINNETGEIRTGQNLADFVDGYFEIIVRANNSENSRRYTENKLKVFIIRDKSLLRFVFAKTPTEVQMIIDDFAESVQAQLKSANLELYILNTQVLTKSDQSLDFSSTSSCFQLSRHGSAIPPHEMQEIMDSENIKQSLLETYVKYSVSAVDSCSVRSNLQTSSLITSPGTWLVILAIFIGIASFIATCTACCLSRRYKKQSRRLIPARVPPEPYGVNAPVLYAEPIYGAL